MKILFTTQALTIGGIEVLALRFSEAFGKSGHEVILYDFNPDLQNQGLIAGFDTTAFRLEYLGRGQAMRNRLHWKLHALLQKSGLNKNYRAAQTERHFARVLKKERPDIICSLSFHQDYLSCKYGAPLGIPVVVSMHGIYEHAAPEWPEHARFIHDQVSAIIYAADKNMDWYREQPYFNHRLPATKIYTGADLDSPVQSRQSRQDLHLAEDAFVFIMVARGIREKGWMEVLLAFRAVHAAQAHTRLLLVGDGTYLQELRLTFAQEPGVLFYGAHPNSVELTALANVGLLPSYFPVETMPNVIIDYLRCSLPVVASDIGEIPAMLRLPDGTVAGAVLPREGNDAGVAVHALTGVMLRLATDAEYYRDQVTAARKAARKFDLKDTMRRYTEVFNAVLKP